MFRLCLLHSAPSFLFLAENVLQTGSPIYSQFLSLSNYLIPKISVVGNNCLQHKNMRVSEGLLLCWYSTLQSVCKSSNNIFAQLETQLLLDDITL